MLVAFMRNHRLLAVMAISAVVGCSRESSPPMNEAPDANPNAVVDSPVITVPPDHTTAEASEAEPAPNVTVELRARETDYFTLGLPEGWLLETQSEEDDDGTVTYSVRGLDASKVFKITVAIDEPRFIQCFCAPWNEYRQFERDGIKFADLTIEFRRKRVRTLKAVGAKFGTDVHMTYANYAPELLDAIVESIRPF